MTTWLVELSEFGLTNKNRGLMKSQFLVDFFTVLPSKGEQLAWLSLSIDRSTNKKFCSTDIILEGTTDIILEEPQF